MKFENLNFQRLQHVYYILTHSGEIQSHAHIPLGKSNSSLQMCNYGLGSRTCILNDIIFIKFLMQEKTSIKNFRDAWDHLIRKVNGQDSHSQPIKRWF